MIRIGLVLAVTLAGMCNVTASHAQVPTATPSVAAAGTAAPVTGTAAASAVASPTPFNTPEPGQLIAPAPQPTTSSVIAPRTGSGNAGGADARLWVGIAAIGVLGVIVGAAGIAARLLAVRAGNR